MNVLLIAPHMDDEVLGAGATLARHSALGDSVFVCIVANRAYNHHYDETKILRQKEHAMDAKRVLGYKELHFLDLPDEQLDKKTIDILVPLETYMQKIQPEIVYINHRGDSNQDHKAVFQAAIIACRSFGLSSIKKVFSYEVLSSTDQAPPFAEYAFLPNYYVNIAPYIEHKKKALGCYIDESRDFPHPRSLKAVEILAHKRGLEVGYEYAEAFCLIRRKLD
jgi:LmbE family N-acetylglucosaminyl deacetylase